MPSHAWHSGVVSIPGRSPLRGQRWVCCETHQSSRLTSVWRTEAPELRGRVLVVTGLVKLRAGWSSVFFGGKAQHKAGSAERTTLIAEAPLMV